jgi:hypothetical protein
MWRESEMGHVVTHTIVREALKCGIWTVWGNDVEITIECESEEPLCVQAFDLDALIAVLTAAKKLFEKAA